MTEVMEVVFPEDTDTETLSVTIWDTEITNIHT